MANTSRIFGFKPVKNMDGSPYNGGANLYYFKSTDATAAYVGDVVKLAGGADAAPLYYPSYGAAPAITLAAAGDAVVGVIIGFVADPTNLNVSGTGRAASTARFCWVADATSLVYEVETSNGTAVVGNIGKNINHAVGAPNSTFARSGATVDVATVATTATLTFKLRGFVPREDVDNTAASAKVWVTINNHQLGAGTGAAGV
jgi:hypothetical protein